MALLGLEFERTGGELEHSATECDGARRDNEDIALVAVKFGKIGGQRGQPGFLEPAGLRIDEERGADFHDDAAEVGERRCFHGKVRSDIERRSLQLRFVLQLRLVLKAIIT